MQSAARQQQTKPGDRSRDELQEFTYLVSHDLNAPLRAVVSFSKMLQEKYAGQMDEKGRRYLAFVQDGGEKAQAMLAGLLSYSRVETQAAPMAAVDCAQMARLCAAERKEQIRSLNATVEVEALPEALADAAQIKQVLHALLANALLYRGREAPAIRFFAETGGAVARICCQDNGIGVDPLFQERIFQPFKRLHTDAEYPGVGMGLAIARKIVERHGGEMGVAGAPGGGSVFWFTLPRYAGQDAPQEI